MHFKHCRPALPALLLAVLLLASCSPLPPAPSAETSSDGVSAQASVSDPQEVSSDGATAPDLQPRPEGDYGYDALPEWAREAYDQMLAGGIREGEPLFFDEPHSYTEVSKLCELYNYNRLEMEFFDPFYLPAFRDGSNDLQYADGIQLASYAYYQGEERERLLSGMEQAADEILSRIPEGADDYTKARQIAEAICARTEYNYFYGSYSDMSEQEREWSRYESHAYGALVLGRSICTGYTKAFAYVAKKAGLSVLSLSGETTSGAHAWNMVWVDGGWYHVDVTWMDSNSTEINYTYFMATDQNIMADHFHPIFGSLGPGTDPHDLGYPAPEATHTENSYFTREGLRFATVDEAIAYLESLEWEAGVPVRIQMGSERAMYELPFLAQAKLDPWGSGQYFFSPAYPSARVIEIRYYPPAA